MKRAERPSAAEHGKLRSALAAYGVPTEHVRTAVGNTVGGRSRGQITEQLKAWLRTRPKKA